MGSLFSRMKQWLESRNHWFKQLWGAVGVQPCRGGDSGSAGAPGPRGRRGLVRLNPLLCDCDSEAV